MGKMAPTVTDICEPDANGTRVTRRDELEPTEPMRLMTPIDQADDRQEQRGLLTNLKRLLEGSGG